MLANNNVITVILFILPNSALTDDTDWAGVTLTMNDPSSRAHDSGSRGSGKTETLLHSGGGGR